jgi:hypothetical protein
MLPFKVFERYEPNSEVYSHERNGKPMDSLDFPAMLNT